ncbi:MULTISPECIES: LmeA family phospholipid-binding protein [Streptomyces]|uniref:LmeA family phospholipid-binding protein n=1 Tax=Streptomyces TaxID=1883 RepID=UPI000699F1A0|nr:DUF2993 domain-containing protein [Streptomyces sp. SID7805]
MRALRVLLFVVVIFGALFVGADRLAVNFAENKAADKIRSSQGLDEPPNVTIKGFPFLTQVAGRTLEEVDADLGGIQARAEGRALRLDQLTAEFRDVELTSDYTSIKSAARATGDARITYADLTKAAGGDVTVSYGGEKNGSSQVKIAPKVAILSSLEVTGTVSAVNGNTVRLRVDKIPTVCAALPGCEAKVRAQTDHDWKLDQLPRNLKLERVVTSPDGIAISASGRNVALPGS